MTKRINVPKDIAIEVLFKNRHTCCICRKYNKHVQIHHIDNNSSNNNLDNLAVLCLDHHSRVTGDEGLGRKFSQSEIKKYKKDWEQICTSQTIEDESDVMILIDKFRTEKLINSNDNYPVFFDDLEEGDEIEFQLESQLALNLMIMNPKDYTFWSRTGSINGYELQEDLFSYEDCFVIPKNGNYCFVFVNYNKEKDTIVKLKFEIWR